MSSCQMEAFMGKSLVSRVRAQMKEPLEACCEQLQEVLEEWIMLGLRSVPSQTTEP